MPHLPPDERDKGSVFLVQKRLTYEPEPSTSTSSGAGAAGAGGDDVEMGDAGAGAGGAAGAGAAGEREWPLLLRATDGNSKKDTKVKLSCIVPPSAAESFLERYSSLLRAAFQPALRPKRKRADLLRARALKAAKRSAAKAKARGEEVPSSEEVEERAVKAVKAGEARAKAASAAAGAAGAGAFRPRLPKIIGPRRGNGVKKRRRAEKRREKAVERVKRKVRARGGAEQQQQ
ncbi:hypothetical protein JCM10450v2_002387 [Rhodotorula kratochvilovae]